MTPSLRRRLLFITLGVFSIAWIASALGAYMDSRHEAEEFLDAELEQVAKVLLMLSEHELSEELASRGIDVDSAFEIHDFNQVRDEYDAKLAFQVWINGQTLALRSNNAPTTAFATVSNGFSVLENQREPWRVFSLTDEGTHTTVHVGEPLSVRDDLVAGAALRTTVPLLVFVPVIGLLIWIGVGHALRPLRKIAEHVAGRNPYDLSPIDAPRAPRETWPLIESLNRLFARLNQAFENTRRFTADAAHELRTPLAGIAAQTDVALLAQDEKVRAAALANVKTATKNLTNLVQQLLTITRWDSDTANVEFKTVDVVSVVQSALRQHENATAAREQKMTATLPSAATIDADETGLQLIVRNIIDNAIRYTPVGGSIHVEVDERDDGIVLSVSDNGPGIPPEQRERIFQRFYRGVPQLEPGSGLGLSIVQRCVELHHGEVKLESSETGGLKVAVRLPKYQYAQKKAGASRRPIVP